MKSGGDKILHFKDAFHRRSGYTRSVTNTDPTKTRDFPKFDWPGVSNPSIEPGLTDRQMAAKEARTVKQIEGAFAADPHGVLGPGLGRAGVRLALHPLPPAAHVHEAGGRQDHVRPQEGPEEGQRLSRPQVEPIPWVKRAAEQLEV